MSGHSKLQHAQVFITALRTMDPAALNRLIVRECGEDLAQFFLTYAANLIQKDPTRVLENCTSLMMMGYLLHSSEAACQPKTGEPQATQPQGRA